MAHLGRVFAEIFKNPKRWIWLAPAIFIEKLLEHRVSAWANDRVDDGVAFMIPQFRDVLKASAEHFWISLFVMAAVYSVGIVVIAHLSALGIRWPWKTRGTQTPPIRGEIVEGWFQTWATTAIGVLDREEERIPEGLAYVVLKVRLARRSDLPATTLRSFTLLMRGPDLAVELRAHRQRFDIRYVIDRRHADDQRVGGPPGELAEEITELGESEYIEPGRDHIGFLRFALDGIDEIEFLHAVDTSVFAVQFLDSDNVEHSFQRAGPLPSRGRMRALPLP